MQGILGKEFLKTELFEKLCKELSGVLYSGTIRFSGFVEPLLDKNIFNLTINRSHVFFKILWISFKRKFKKRKI